MVVDFRCEECGFTIEDVEAETSEDLPKRKDCPNCGKKRSCYRLFNDASIHIPTHFKALEADRGVNQARDRMKNYKGQNGRKIYY